MDRLIMGNVPSDHKDLQKCSLFGWLVADGWCWFALREKYCWLVADKPSEQDDGCHLLGGVSG
jgi:hypothetical protein